MSRTQTYKKVLSLVAFQALTLCIFAQCSSAQYQGDLFFNNPSVPVEEGASAELEVMAFAGGESLGAAMFDVVYNVEELELEAVTTGASEDFQSVQASFATPGKIRIGAVSGETDSKNIGSVSLAQISVRPKVPSGSTASITLVPIRILKESGEAFRNSDGLLGEVIVTSAGAQLLGSSDGGTLTAEEERLLGERSKRFARPGMVVPMTRVDKSGNASWIEVETPNDNVVSESPSE